MKVVLSGATGYTGKLTLAALIKRGIRPLIAGRNSEKLKELSSQYSHLETEVADINDLSSVQNLLNEGDILITTVGPFMRYGITALEAAISKKAHYIDSTGEPEFVRQVIQNYGERAIQAKITLLTAAAYDYVPGQCAAALAIEKSGPTANRVDDELDTVVLDGVNGYTFTADMIAWVCQQFLHGKQQAVGAIGPIEAFGVKAVLQGCEESGLNLISPD